MRVGILDVGSNSARLLVADLAAGRPPVTVRVTKSPVRLAEATDRGGVISHEAVDRVICAVREASAAADSAGAEELIPFATSALRDAANGARILAEVRAATGVTLGFMNGEQEARLTFMAARSWYGWSAGTMLLADIGGGSMELAYGPYKEPEIALSLPLGAGRLTRHHLPDRAPVKKKDRQALHDHVSQVVEQAAAALRHRPAPVRTVATSKTFTQLARLCGAPKTKAGLHVRRSLPRDALLEWIPELAKRSRAERARLPGVKASRAAQILAGAIVAHATMEVLGIDSLDICPWAIREGVMLHRLEVLTDPSASSAPLLTMPTLDRDQQRLHAVPTGAMV